MKKLFFKKDVLFLIAIILFSGFIYFYKIDKIPSGFYVDEASVAYNARSIVETGKDEYGKSFPVILRSYDDYKPALYAYLIIPFMYLFGLNIFSVRIVSAIFGVIAIVGTYFLIKELLSPFFCK